jgi:putative addiction module component (TIGR02574 family)
MSSSCWRRADVVAHAEQFTQPAIRSHAGAWTGDIRGRRLLRSLSNSFSIPRSSGYTWIEVKPMEHLSLPEPPGFAALSKAEQIQYLQQLWDRISEHPGEVPVPSSHLDLAEERLAEYRRDPSRARPAFDVIDQLRNSAAKNR